MCKRSEGGEAASLSPICDFVRGYVEGHPTRLHMPGHKGVGPLGCEELDITEIDGADDLYAPTGVIARSQAVASRLFGCPTSYSAEGSSLALRAMLYLALCGKSAPKGRPVVLAGRNAHRVLLTAAALIDFDLAWLLPHPEDAYCACAVTPGDVAAALAGMADPPAAVYVTSPDYLGHVLDIEGIADVCHAHGVPLLVDGAHGAYLRFLTPSRHPMDLGADLCCASAHKTLPALTGAAYLHVRDEALAARAPEALALFGSTSPSWLILQSLDALNPVLADYPAALAGFVPKLDGLKARLRDRGFALAGDEPLKLTLDARAVGATGDALAARLQAEGLACEFHDPDFLTLMLTPSNPDADLTRLEACLMAAPIGPAATVCAPAFHLPRRRMTVRQAMLAPRETLPTEACEGRVLAAPSVACPPAVPIAMPGEEVDRASIERFLYYGIGALTVVAEG